MLQKSVVLCVCISIAILSMQGGIDPISVWIVSLLDSMNGGGWQGLYSPILLPHPMNDYVFRPVSILLVKGGFWLGGETLHFPSWLIGLKAFFVAGSFALGAWVWLRQFTCEWWAMGLTSMGLFFDSSIFTAYNFTEFDGMGAGFILMSSWALANKRWWRFGVCVILAVFLKESIAISLVLFLLPQFWLDFRNGEFSKIGFGILGAILGFWLLGVSPILLGKMQSGAGQLSIGSRLSIVGYTWCQLLVLCTETGAMLLFAAFLSRKNKLLGLGLTGGLLLWGMIAPMGIINHFQTYYFSRPIYISVLLAGLIVVFAGWIWKSTELRRLFALQVLSVFGGFSFVILISSNLREDLASRLFLVFLPGFLLFTLRAFVKLWRSSFGLAIILYLGQVWSIVSGGWNMASEIIFEQSQLSVFYEATGQQLKEAGILLFSDMNRPINIDYLSEIEGENKKDLRIARIEYYPKKAQLPPFLQHWNLALLQSFQQGTPIYFWNQFSQVKLSQQELEWLQADFSWIRGNVNQGSHAPIGLSDSFLPDHSLLEDLYFRRYPTEASNLDVLLKADFHRLIYQQKGYYTLPTRLIELPLRVLNGISILEPRVFQQELWIKSRATGNSK